MRRPAVLHVALVAVIVSGAAAAWASFEALRARAEVTRLRAALAAAQAQRPRDPRPPPASTVGASATGALSTLAHLRRLRDAGLDDPLADLRADLQAHPELIPIAGTLGGRMGFYSPEDIVLLGDRWVYAYFEDGHRAGSMLLAFEVAPGGEIVWKPLAGALW